MTAVEAAIAHYDRLLDEHGERCLELLAAATERHQMLGRDGRWWCVTLRPYIIAERDHGQLMRVTALVARGLHAAAERLAADRALREQLGIPADLESLLALDARHPHPSVFGRFDAMLDPQGRAMFIEHNSEPQSLSRRDEVDRAFDRMPIARAFARRFPYRTVPVLDHVLTAIHRDHRARGGSGPPVIAVLKNGPRMAQAAYLRWVPHAAARGCTVLLAGAEEFELRGGRLRVGRDVVDSVLFSDWLPVVEQAPETRPIFRAIADGIARPLFGLSRGLLYSYKSTFELLSDPRHAGLYPAEVAGALREHIPWTRVLRECRTTLPRGGDGDLVPFVAENREQLVLKPSGGTEGRRIVLGWEVAQPEWEAAVRRCLRRQYVVQRRVAGERRAWPVVEDGAIATRELLADIAPYLWNGARTDGCLVRVSPEDVVNIAASGSIPALWIVADDPGG